MIMIIIIIVMIIIVIIIIIVMIIIIILISWGFTPRGFPNVNCSGWNRQCHDHNHQIIVKCIIGMRIAWELWACVLAIWAGSPSWSPWLPYNEKCLEVGDDLLLIMFLWWSLVIYTVLSWISPIKKNKICLFSDLETSNPIRQTKYLGSHWGYPWISIFSFISLTSTGKANNEQKTSKIDQIKSHLARQCKEVCATQGGWCWVDQGENTK